MRVTKWGECGILCALYLARQDDLSTAGAAEIAESQGLDLPYTQQVLQRLRKGEIIESVRGPKGGYKLKRRPAQITLREILYAAEGDTFQVICDTSPLHPATDQPHRCLTRQSCSLHGVWQELRSAIDHLLEQKSLEDLLKNEGATELVQLRTSGKDPHVK